MGTQPYLSPAVPGRERWPKTSDGFRRRFGFGRGYERNACATDSEALQVV